MRVPIGTVSRQCVNAGLLSHCECRQEQLLMAGRLAETFDQVGRQELSYLNVARVRLYLALAQLADEPQFAKSARRRWNAAFIAETPF